MLKLTKNKILIISNVVIILTLIIFSNLGFLPLENFLIFGFFSVAIFIFAWWRLRLFFLFFVGIIILENINLVPAELGVNIRPYQLLGGIIFLVFLVKLVLNKLNFKLPKFCWKDGLILTFILAGFLSTIFSENQIVSLKQSIIITSFGLLYFLFKVFIQNFQDLKKVIPFFLSSSFVVVIYGIWQNWQFMRGSSHFEIMAGRPNTTFSEPDWLGMFLVFLVASLYILIFKKYYSIKNIFKKGDCLFWFYYSFLVLTFILLILTVARSAWLGVGMVTIIYLFLILLESLSVWLELKKGFRFRIRKNNFFKKIFKNLNWKSFFSQSFIIFSTGIISISLVFFLNLTNFELGNRIQSTGSGKQEITISCVLMFDMEQNNFLNSSIREIENISELKKYNCRHINLEEIESEELKGNLVTKIYRSDPNVNVRAEVYRKSWREIKGNWILGIGWGNIGSVLGMDDSDTVLNSSNIFLEVWLGAGILGIISFMILIFSIFWQGIINFISKEDIEKKLFGMFLILGVVAILIPNLFNAGIMLGFLWLFFGVSEMDDF
ncbi:MAG: O-antigen ligase family protein [Candidatus Moranbacteria bacterium]|nr:O-antigen ligase family protein [Candidatus Moranbacteria bacterium]